ncbi:MAG: RNA polymerase sigma factor [Candidatus Margulisbacteria bacterium]|nr:RNA polymerase sigma factor [Candidatus Margulisiibacteriota bacterium]
MTEETDILIKQARIYNEKALAQLTEMFYKKIYTYIYYRVNTIEDAQDLTHDVFVRMVQGIKKQSGNFASWLYTIAGNVLKDFYRKKSVHNSEQTMNKLRDITKSSIDIENRALDVETVRSALKVLPNIQQDIIILKFIADLSNKGVAKIIKKSEGAVKVLQNRALNKLKLVLEKNYVRK